MVNHSSVTCRPANRTVADDSVTASTSTPSTTSPGLAILVSPPEARTAVYIAIGVVLAGGLYFVYLLVTNREVLETEPGDIDVFKH